MARNAEPTREKANVFTRLSILIGPANPGDNPGKDLVEPPGIAPGSSPLITCAFIAIDRANPDASNIGTRRCEMKKIRSRSADGVAFCANRRFRFASGL